VAILSWFKKYFLEKKIYDKIFPFEKRMLPFEDFFRKKKRKRLAPNIIDKWIFQFFISRYVDIQVVNKWWISENILIRVGLKRWKSGIWPGDINFKNNKNVVFLSTRQKKKVNILIKRISQHWSWLVSWPMVKITKFLCLVFSV
jgi:hypothetical protein